jgi:hypothetical protein
MLIYVNKRGIERECQDLLYQYFSLISLFSASLKSKTLANVLPKYDLLFVKFFTKDFKNEKFLKVSLYVKIFKTLKFDIDFLIFIYIF